MNNQFVDIIGTAASEYYRTKKPSYIIVHSDISIADYIYVPYLFRKYQFLPDIEKFALRNCEGRVLDIGAGAGCHSVILQDKNFDVTSIDISQLCVDVMRKRGLKSVHCTNILNFNNEKFDTLLMMMNGIGVVGNFDGLNTFLIHAHSLLKPNGQIIFDSSDLIYMFDSKISKDKLHLHGKYYGQVTYRLEYNGQTGEPFDWLYLDFDTISKYANKHSYTCELIFSGENYKFLVRLKEK